MARRSPSLVARATGHSYPWCALLLPAKKMLQDRTTTATGSLSLKCIPKRKTTKMLKCDILDLQSVNSTVVVMRLGTAGSMWPGESFA